LKGKETRIEEGGRRNEEGVKKVGRKGGRKKGRRRDKGKPRGKKKKKKKNGVFFFYFFFFFFFFFFFLVGGAEAIRSEKWGVHPHPLHPPKLRPWMGRRGYRSNLGLRNRGF